jgi:hypothetical protein
MDEIEGSPNWITSKEIFIENKITELLWSLGVDSSVKTDKKSLPYKEIFETTLERSKPFSSYFYDKIIYREFIHHILDKGYRKIRFYCELIQMDSQIDVWVVEGKTNQITLKPDYKCFIKYYIHH